MKTNANLLLAASLVLVFSESSRAANQTWNDAGIDNNWDTSTANWVSPTTWAPGNTAVFNGAGEAITLITGITTNGLTFDTAGYTISGNVLSLGAGPSTITTIADATISSVLASASNGLTKAGTGKLTLGGANTYRGATIINAGTLSVTGGAKLYAGYNGNFPGFITINTSGTLEFDNPVYNNSFGETWASSYIAINGGTARFTGAAATWSNNAIQFGANGGTIDASGSGLLTIGGMANYAQNAAASVTLSGSGSGSFGQVLSGNGGVTKSGSGTWSLTSANTYNGATTVNLGTLNITNTLRNSSGITVKTGATLNIGATNIFTTGHGVAMNNTRVLTVDGGTMVFTGSFDARFGNVALKNGATWTSNRGTSNGYDALLGDTSTGAATVTVANSGGNTTGSTMNGSGGIRLSGMPNFEVADVTGNPTTDLTVNMAIYASGSVGGTGGINKLGAGTMRLAAANTYTGATTVTQGTMELSGSLVSGVTVANGATFAPIGSGVVNANITINSGGTLDTSAASGIWSPASTRTLSVGRTTTPATDVIGNLAVATGATLHIGSGSGTAATLTGNGNLRLTGGKTVFDLTLLPAGINDTVSLTGTLDIVNPSELEFNLKDLVLGNGVYPLVTAAGGITGNLADLTPLGLPSATGGRQTFALSTTTIANSLTLDVTGVAGLLVWNDASLNGIWDTTEMNWRNGAIDDIFYNGDSVSFEDTANATETITIPDTVEPSVLNAVNTAATTFVLTGPGKISGSAQLNVTGGGTLLLSTTGGNNFTGPVTVSNASTLGIGDAAALPATGQVQLLGGTLDVGTTAGALAGTISMIGASVLTASGGQLAATAIIAQGGLIAADLIGSGSLAVTNNSTVQLNAAASHSGGTTIAAGSTMELYSNANIANGIVNNGILSGMEAATTTVNLTGTISGTGAVQQNGSGTLRLNGAQTYSGATTVNGGTLDLATGDARLYSDTYRTTTLTIQTGGTLRAARLSHGFANNLGQLTNNCPNSVINGGTLDLVGIADTSARGWTIGTNGATIRSAGATAQVWQPSNEAWTQIDLNNGATLTFDVGGTFQLKSTIMDYTGTPGGAGGVSTSNGGVIKTGAGTLTMSALTLTAAAGSHRYTGTTSIQQGTLVLDVSLGTSPVVVSDSATFAIGGGIATVGTGGLTLGATSTLTLQVDTTSVTADRINVAGNVALNGATLNLSTLGASTLTAGTKFTLISYSGSLSGEFSGLLEGSNISIGANTFKLRYADTNAVTLEVVSSGYSGWASANGANGQNPDQDHDNDGMPNGLEYFMGETGSSFTANPSVVNGKVIWPKDPAAIATYVVQISSNLKDEVTSGDGGWSNTTSGVVDTGTAVEFTLPNGDPRRFARIQVIVP